MWCSVLDELCPVILGMPCSRSDTGLPSCPSGFLSKEGEVSSQLGVKDASHILQQCAKRVKSEQSKEGKVWEDGRKKRSGETFPAWIGQVTSLVSLGNQYTCIPTASHFWEQHWPLGTSHQCFLVDFKLFLCTRAPLRACSKSNLDLLFPSMQLHRR